MSAGGNRSPGITWTAIDPELEVGAEDEGCYGAACSAVARGGEVGEGEGFGDGGGEWEGRKGEGNMKGRFWGGILVKGF